MGRDYAQRSKAESPIGCQAKVFIEKGRARHTEKEEGNGGEEKICACGSGDCTEKGFQKACGSEARGPGYCMEEGCQACGPEACGCVCPGGCGRPDTELVGSSRARRWAR